MINAAPEETVVDSQGTPSAWQAYGRGALIVIVVVWTLAMILSMREGFFDRFVAGASHGNIGNDFFCTPRGFRNLIAGRNIFLTEMDDYVPYSTPFLSHPFVAILIGPWTAPLPPYVAYGVFVAVSLVLLATSAGVIARQFDGKILRAFTLFALFCSLPTYLMLWNAQVHVVLILAVALMLAGLIGLERDEQSSARSLRMVQVGLVISLLSKPVALLALPVLFATRETRRALILPMVVYAAVSVLFLLTPALNSGGYNGVHWLNLLSASSLPKTMWSLVFPRELDLVSNPDIYCLPVYLHRLVGAPVPWVLTKLPVLAILAMSTLPLVLVSRRRRIRVLIATFMLCLLSHFLCYYMVWEYQYTTLLPTLPVLWWMSQEEERADLRWPLRIAFIALLANFLPTFYFLAPQTPMRYATASTLLRVLPVVIAFACLLLYGVGNGWAALREGSDGMALPRGQLLDLIKTGAVLTLSCGAVAASVFVSTPDRLAKPLPQWTSKDWSTHVEDLLAHTGPGLLPAELASMHDFLGGYYFDTNRPLAIEHYDAAMNQLAEHPDALCELGDRILRNGHVDVAISVYRRVLQSAPDHQVARERLRQLQDRSRPEMR